MTEIELVQHLSSLEAKETMMRTQYEWLFVNMTVTNKTIDTFHHKQDVLVYTVSQPGCTQAGGFTLVFGIHLVHQRNVTFSIQTSFHRSP